MQDIIIVLFSCLHVEKEKNAGDMCTRKLSHCVHVVVGGSLLFKDVATVVLCFDHCVIVWLWSASYCWCETPVLPSFFPITVIVIEKEMVGYNIHSHLYCNLSICSYCHCCVCRCFGIAMNRRHIVMSPHLVMYLLFINIDAFRGRFAT